ncbi:MAG: pirin family protein [Thermoplasmata archaeon]
MTVSVVRKSEHYHTESGWLSTYWHFSFDRYFDPKNVSFGPLRVFNDDRVEPGGGWGVHPHRDMEIITYVADGRLEHTDSSGSKALVKEGGVQRMTAGRGIWHSETNPSNTDSLRLLQIWIHPDERGLPPSHESRQFSKSRMKNTLLPVVSSRQVGDALAIHQDVTTYVSMLAPGKEVAHTIGSDRRGYLFVVEGELKLPGDTLMEGDVLRVVGKEDLQVEAAEPSELILLDLPLD